MALDVIQVEGCYVSSSLPKALFVPAPSPYHRTKRDNLHSSDILCLKPKTRSAEKKKTPRLSNCELPVEGRQHLAVQTDLYLEELCDVVEEADAQCETDSFLDVRPPSPLFIPAKSGVDVETQIYPGELFDFDEEVEPILEILVEQTLEDALIELIAEQETTALTDLKKDYYTRRMAEEAEIKRFDEKEQSLSNEEEKRIKEQEEAILLEDEVAQKIMACIFSQNYLSELVPQVYKKLEVEGYFDTEDPDVQEMEEGFWPWLMNEVDSEIATLEASCQLLDTLIEDSVQYNPETSVINSLSNTVQEDEGTLDKINLQVNASISQDYLEIQKDSDLDTPKK